jgi:hypothetical protein
MDIYEIAENCIDLWEKQAWFAAFDKYYSDDAVNAEPMGWRGIPAEVVGKQAIIEKYKWLVEEFWLSVDSIKCSEPYFFGNERFAVVIEHEVTPKQTGQRTHLVEVGVYTVSGGKVIREEFFYDKEEIDMYAPPNHSAPDGMA